MKQVFFCVATVLFAIPLMAAMPKDEFGHPMQIFTPSAPIVKVIARGSFWNFSTARSTGDVKVIDFKALNTTTRAAIDMQVRIGGFATGSETNTWVTSAERWGVQKGVTKIGFMPYTTCTLRIQPGY